VAAFLLLAWGTTLLAPRPAEADEESEKWKGVALSDVGVNQRLMALEVLRQKGGTSATDALAAVAADGDLAVAAAACAQLGRLETSASKGKLKALLEDTSRAVEVRIAAASAIAEHWKDSGDESYLETESEGNATLEAHVAVLKARVYGQ
jgi:hypothetical protein